jgi:hypothetical protein
MHTPLLNADLGGGRGLSRGVTDVFAFVGGVATTIVERAKRLSYWVQMNLAHREFGRRRFQYSIACSNDASRTQSLG